MFDQDQLDERPVYRHIQIISRLDARANPVYYPLFGCARTVTDANIVLRDGGWLGNEFILEVGDDENIDEVHQDTYYYRDPRPLNPEPGRTFSYVLGGRLQFN